MKIRDLLNGPIPLITEGSNEHFKWARSIAAQFPHDGLDDLKALRVKGHAIPAYESSPPYIFSTIENSHSEALPFVGELTSLCWRSLGGYSNADKALASVRKARVQIGQALLFDSLLDYCYLNGKLEALEQHELQYISALESSFPSDTRYLDPAEHLPHSPFMGPVEIVEAWITESENDSYQHAHSRSIETSNKDLRDALYATALVWLDRALDIGPGNHCTNLICISSHAMHVASMFDGLELADKASKAASATYGEKGARIRHRKTEELKAWALAEAKDDHQLPRVLAKRLVHEIPQRLHNASNDPERLIYEALLLQRKKQPARG